MVELRNQQVLLNFHVSLWAEMKIPFQLLGWIENSISAGKHTGGRGAWHACASQALFVMCNFMVVLPARATMLPSNWTSRLVAQSRIFILSDHRFHFSSARPCQLWAEMTFSFQRSSWNEIFISAQQLKWKLLNATKWHHHQISFKPFHCFPSRGCSKDCDNRVTQFSKVRNHFSE